MSYFGLNLTDDVVGTAAVDTTTIESDIVALQAQMAQKVDTSAFAFNNTLFQSQLNTLDADLDTYIGTNDAAVALKADASALALKADQTALDATNAVVFVS